MSDNERKNPRVSTSIGGHCFAKRLAASAMAFALGSPSGARAAQRRNLLPDQGGRTDIQVHECKNPQQNPYCSQGCIVTSPSTFDLLNSLLGLENGFNTLEVYGSGDSCGPLPDACE